MPRQEKERRYWTYDEVAVSFVAKAAGVTVKRFRDYVEYDDIQQEIYVWLYGSGKDKVIRWLSNEPQQTTRIYRSMLDVARSYAEKEKATQAGYEIDDLYWYSPVVVDLLKPMALDPHWKPQDEHPDQQDGNPGKRSKPAREGGDLLAMVMDVRDAVSHVGAHTEAVVEFLGGRRPKMLGQKP